MGFQSEPFSQRIASTIKPVINSRPIANAGPNQILNENTTVALVGAGIDLDPNDTLSYLWRQTDGPAVDLSNRSSTNPTFPSPIVPSDTELKFSLTITDDKGATSDSSWSNYYNQTYQPTSRS